MKIGLFGGSFDPPTIAHMMMVLSAKEAFGLEKVVLIPAKHSPLKASHNASAEDRMVMTVMAAGDVGLEIDMIEMVREDKDSFTIDTVREYKLRYPDDELYLIIGPDVFFQFNQFKDSDEIRKLVTLAVQWSNDEQDEEFYPIAENVKVFSTFFSRFDISSTQVRNHIKTGHSCKYLVPETVRLYIEEKGLYK
jgi:nicotinate-nucleotide adenylyltransferase